jgi:hypothetical protein
MTGPGGLVSGTVVMCRKRHWIGDVYSTSNLLFVPATPGGTAGRMTAISDLDVTLRVPCRKCHRLCRLDTAKLRRDVRASEREHLTIYT